MKINHIALMLVCSIALMLTGTGRLSAAVPTNDNCAGAIAVGNVTDLAFSTSEATFDGPGHFIEGPNIWYIYTATCTGCAEFSLCGSSYDSAIAVYDSTSCYPSISDLVAWNDDYCDGDGRVIVPVTAGNSYLIEVGGYYLAKGYGKLTINCSTGSCYASNDDCSNAQLIGNVSHMPFDTSEATFDGPGLDMDGPNLWYLYRAAATGDVTVSLCGSDYDTKLAIYNGYTCPIDETDIIDSSDDYLPCGLDSQVTFAAIADNYYLIEVGGISPNYNRDFYGQGEITITSDGAAPCPPANNNCSNAQPIGNVTNLAFDTTCATFDGPGYCMHSANIWYLYTAPCTGEATISLCGSSYDTQLAVYDTDECYPLSSELLGCNDDYCSSQSQLTIDVVQNGRYLIEVGGWDSSSGTGILNISTSCSPVTSNDNCSNATPIGNVTNMPFNTTAATFDGPGHCMYGPNLWYLYTATCSGTATISLCGSSYDTQVAVYNTGSCYPLASELMACNDDYCGRQSQVTINIVNGNSYLIEVGGWGSETGQGVITITSQCSVVTKVDLGDAPDSTNNYTMEMTAYPKGGPSGVIANYPTVFADGYDGPYGPIHSNSTLVAYLGNAISGEVDADTGSDEDGLNNLNPNADSSDKDKKDDGVIVPLNMPAGEWTTFTYTVNVIDPDIELWVNVWCDWNRDGDWDDDSNSDPTMASTLGKVSEWAVQNQFLFNLDEGLNQLTTPAFIPYHANTGDIWMRITLSEQPWVGGSNPGELGNGGSGPQTGYVIGETEDYYFTPTTDSACPLCEDLNEDGVINTNDLTILMNRWLDECL